MVKHQIEELQAHEFLGSLVRDEAALLPDASPASRIRITAA